MLTKLAEAIERLFDTDDGGEPLVCSARSFTVTVRCARCGEVIPVRVDRDHELQAIYAEDAHEGDRPLQYVLRKELVGEGCQNLIRFTIRFNCDHGLIESQIEGGEFVEKRGRERADLTESVELST
ncbi:MAG: hypothetical protein ACOX9R_01805 [Armatimonadota bacterium]